MLHHLTHELPLEIRHLLERTQPPEPVAELPRRSFLKLSVASGFALGMVPIAVLGQAGGAATELKPNQLPGTFVKVAPDGVVTVVVNRVEMGQGAHTALPMLLAEELDADWSLVRSEAGSNDGVFADPLWGIHITGGSASLKNSYLHYRELGARARVMLIRAAATRWGVDAAQLKTERGTVVDPSGRHLSYGELSTTAMALPVPEAVALKAIKDFQIIGHSVPRLDSRAKSTGTQGFGIDVYLPGQLTAVVAHPPVFGAKVKAFDDSKARAIKGVKAIVRIPLVGGGQGIAIIADGFWPAKQGRDALNVTWNDEGVEKVDSARQLAAYRELAKQPGKLSMDADMKPLASAPNVIKAEFVLPYLAHAPMEPISVTVRLEDGGAELWVGSQFPGFDTGAASKVLGLKPEQIKMNVMMAGGGFGRRGVFDGEFVAEACEIAKAGRNAGLNAPVRMVRTREDDIRGGYYRPMSLHRAEIGFDAAGKVLAWDHRIVGQSIMAGSPMESAMLKDGVDTTTVEGMRIPYLLPMRLTVHHTTVNVPVQVWRGVGHSHTGFVMETLIDEICRRTKQDPVAYRMKMYGSEHPRYQTALQLAVDKSGYGKKRLPAGRAWGVAVHGSYDSVVAYVVEASVKNGQPTLHKVTAGVHCNLAVNPKLVEDQVQGAAVMGLSACLPGSAITLMDGVVEQQNFNDYTVARITDVPTFSVHIVPSAEPPTGMGEPGLPPLAPAFGNAISKLTGKPLRSMPFRIV
jgi:isoquinoline 1-oxidoreductase subunit beta